MLQKNKIIILVVVGVIVIAGIASYFAYQNKIQTSNISENAPVNNMPVDSQKPLTIQLPPPTEAEKISVTAQTIANIFVERFGTYTNQSGYASLNELKPLLTVSMVQWLTASYIPKLIKEHDPAGFFYGITAKAVTTKILEQKNAAMKVRVATMREETLGTADAQRFLQEILLDLVMVNGTWLVDGAYWQTRK